MSEFPEALDGAICAAAAESGFTIARRTNSTSNNILVWWLEANTRRRLEFTLTGDYIDVIGYKDTYPFSPKYFLYLEELIGSASIRFNPESEWHLFDRLLLSQTRESYRQQVCACIEFVKNM